VDKLKAYDRQKKAYFEAVSEGKITFPQSTPSPQTCRDIAGSVRLKLEAKPGSVYTAST